MLVKGMTLFLIAMAVLAMFGKLRFPGMRARGGKPARLGERCSSCGRPRIGTTPCPCKTKA